MKRISLLLLLFCSLASAAEITPPDSAPTPAAPMQAAPAEKPQVGDASLRTLSQLGQGILRYLRARGRFPQMKNPLDWMARRTFYPYVGDERLFMLPDTEIPYRFNEILSGKKPAHIINPQSFAVFYEAEPSDKEMRAVLFLDGHVERVRPAHWERIKKASKIGNHANG
jgi:prepilin-type processing-associated H-X9-DG protein